MPVPNIAPAGFEDYQRPKEWHEAINPFAAAYRGVTPLATGTNAALTPEDYDFYRAMQEAQAQQAAARTGQQTNADAILARALGQGGPSLAEMQLREASDRALKQQAGAIGAFRGQNPALARRQIADQTAAAQQQMAGQAAMLRAQEQQAAQALAGQAFGQIRSQDQGMFGAAGQGRQAQNQLTVGSDLQAQGMNLQRDLANQQAIQRNQSMMYGADQNAAQRNVNIASGLGQAALGAAGLGGGKTEFGAMAGEAMQGNPYYKFADGGVIPGQALVPGDSPRNDVVPIMAAPGEVVIPRTKATPDGAYDFVKSLKEQSSDDDRVARIFDLQARLDALKQGMYRGGIVGGKKGC